MKIYVYGDIGGWYKPFRDSLEKIGVDTKKRIFPKDTVVIQVGDLIDKGPYSESVVSMVDDFLRDAPDQYIQLWGNHEARLIGGPDFLSPSQKEYSISSLAKKRIKTWDANSLASIAVGVIDGNLGELLVTHSGITAFLWNDLGQPNLKQSVNLLNGLPNVTKFAAGLMLSQAAWGYAGPVWAECVNEVYVPWLDHKVPYGQVHGHTSAFRFHRGMWNSMPRELLLHASVDKTKRHTRINIKGKPFIGIDPGFGQYEPYFDLMPLELEGEIIRP
jgi:hypothetical protein